MLVVTLDRFKATQCKFFLTYYLPVLTMTFTLGAAGGWSSGRYDIDIPSWLVALLAMEVFMIGYFLALVVWEHRQPRATPGPGPHRYLFHDEYAQ
ncbi:hypothetical protein [Nocardia sp. CNY236]|uniref:hypothetical protein n=1 Tax=Nocardia sp. CNY236 TaxID=1169152 RepID=UPI000404627B|nr:hypothetical protein [Nocardia sp. CNY236]